MALTITPAIQQRIIEQERGRHARLLQRAAAMQLMVDRDYCSSSSCMMWQPTVQGRCEVVRENECSCREFALWGDCPHIAVMLTMIERSAYSGETL